jgi:hypothetical protein
VVASDKLGNSAFTNAIVPAEVAAAAVRASPDHQTPIDWLRRRHSDLSADQFLALMLRRAAGREAVQWARDCRRVGVRHDWQGNVRQSAAVEFKPPSGLAAGWNAWMRPSSSA